MGRKANWFRAVKQALGPECKERKDERSTKSKKKWFLQKKKDCHPIPMPSTATENSAPANTTSLPPVAVDVIKQVPVLPSENVKLKEEEDEQKKHAQSIAIATAKAAEAAAAAAQAAAEVVRLTNAAQFPGKPKEDVSALRIQTAFRGYLARRALRVLRGLASLKILMRGQCMNHHTTSSLKSVQSLARLQSQVQARRLKMWEDSQAGMGPTPERQVKVENVQENANDWDPSQKCKERSEGRVQSQHEATMRRERALAYSLNHQVTLLRNSSTSKSAEGNLLLDMKNEHSGWSWLERWLAARPWEKQTSASSSPKSRISGSNARALSRKPKPTSPKASPRRSLCCPDDEDAKSAVSVQSTSPVAHTLPSYMAPTESARAKKRASSPARSRLSTSSITDANSIAEQQNFINAM